MSINEEMKKQVILLIVIVVGLFLISILSNIFYQESEAISLNKTDNLLNTTVEEESKKQEELSINGITETQLQNMKGLINQDTYDIYLEYFENNGEKSLEQIEVERATEDINSGKNGTSIDKGVDYISEEEQGDLEKELEEALQMYGYSTGSSND